MVNFAENVEDRGSAKVYGWKVSGMWSFFVLFAGNFSVFGRARLRC